MVGRFVLLLMAAPLVFPVSGIAADLKGAITFEGTPPPEQAISMDTDPNCAKLHSGDPRMTENFVIGPNKGICWVFVYLKEGVKGSYPPPAEPVVLDQKGCHYEPLVFGVQVGQKVILKNSDPLLHNVHILSRENKEANIGMALPGEIEHIFDKPEVMIPIKCDIHKWMESYCTVMEHPFFAVTKEDGSYEIKNIPPGEYKLAFRHKRMGEQIVDLKVTDSPAEQNFSFNESMIKGRRKKAG
jgi:plastocyanin